MNAAIREAVFVNNVGNNSHANVLNSQNRDGCQAKLNQWTEIKRRHLHSVQFSPNAGAREADFKGAEIRGVLRYRSDLQIQSFVSPPHRGTVI